MQECSNSSTLAMELLQSCTKNHQFVIAIYPTMTSNSPAEWHISETDMWANIGLDKYLLFVWYHAIIAWTSVD